ncbi:flavonoid 3',5'-hydroxylase [Salvia divinorum]|uniref:Flavonoid 3',5'-hydroxylase n=1 Tax=Salvia divinorum TaxID=28513 RepID=A0ABD1IKQ9_SALDI
MQAQEYMLLIARGLVVATLLYSLIRLFISKIITIGHPLPPGPRGFPVVGSLPLLGDMPHVALAKMAKTYGPIMYMKMGSSGIVVVSTPDSARAFLKTQDANFSNRPVNAGATILAYNAQDMVFAPYGPKWRLLKKLSSLHMLGSKALEEWSDVRSSEASHMLAAMYEASRLGEAVCLPETLVYATANMIGQVILSRRVFVTKGNEMNEFKEMVVELMTTAGYFNIGDFIPWLAWMDLQGIERGMKKLHKKWDRLIGKMLDDRLKSTHKRNDKPDLLDSLLANHDDDSNDDEEDCKLTTTNIKALLLNLFTAGTDTSSSIIEWALAEMIKNPSIQKRAHEEMDKVIGRERHLLESDIPNLPYLRAICKEAYRKHPSTPLNLPRISTHACVVDGYHIPKNTRLSVNIWAIGRDPDVWENPLDFNPERFLLGLKGGIEPGGNHFELIPFGAGRRICAGSRMGMVIVEYLLATLVHSFEWDLPSGTAEMDMDEIFGLALQKAVPLSASLTPRLPSHCYAPPST